jgi:prephenate dehydrogenase
MTIHFNKVAIIGVGLIGGSLAIVLRRKGMAGSIVGIGRGMENLDAARRLGVVDVITQDIGAGVKDADLVVVAVPVLKIAETVRKAAPDLKKGCILTDVGSVKQSVIEEVAPIVPEGVHFVPGHPIAGTENSGVEAAIPDLFTGRTCILTPIEKTDADAVNTVKTMWQEAGSKVIIMDAVQHDRALAAVSHLPHMIAYTLVNTIADMKGEMPGILDYSAGGFRDFTRIASSSPEMWSDICAMNKESIVKTITDFQERLQGLKKKVEAGDLEGLKEDFERAKRLRDTLVHKSRLPDK